MKKVISVIFSILLGLSILYFLGIILISFTSPSLVLNQSQVNFGAIHRGVGTKSQEVMIETINPLLGTHKLLRWKASAEKEWLYVRSPRGIGKGVIQIGVKYSRLEPGNYRGQVKIFTSKAKNSPQEIKVHVKVYEKGKSDPPFGFIDIPGEHQSIISPLMKIEGWALDDIEVVKVSVKRDPLPGESSLVDPDGLIYLGDAVFRKGLRKDVRKAFPGFPLNHRAGWWFSLEPRFLSSYVSSPIDIHIIALDKEGHKKDLGQRTILIPGKK